MDGTVQHHPMVLQHQPTAIQMAMENLRIQQASERQKTNTMKGLNNPFQQFPGASQIAGNQRNVHGSAYYFHATGNGLQDALIGAISVVTLKSSTAERMPITALNCTLVSELTSITVNCNVVRQGNDYEISYQPSIKGRNKLHVVVDGQHIRGSPFSIGVRDSLERLGIQPILTYDGLAGPFGVALSSKRQELVVTERDRHCVSIFGFDGKKGTFGTKGSGEGHFDAPYGVAVDNMGCILVADHNNHRIQKFSAEGRFIAARRIRGSGFLQLSLPTGIAYNAINNKIYVLDVHYHRVSIINSDLTHFSAFGKKGNGRGEFNFAWGIACDSTGKVYVADTANHRIQVFTSNGELLRIFGRCGLGRGEMNFPNNIVVANNIVYISNSTCISVFTSEGQFVTSFGMQGARLGEFNCPRGVAADSDGVVYVCDCKNNRLQLF